MKLSFLDIFSENSQLSNFVTIRPVGSEVFHTDGEMDRQTESQKEADNEFSIFCESALKEMGSLV